MLELVDDVAQMLDAHGASGASDLRFTSDRGALVMRDKRNERLTLDVPQSRRMLEALVDHLVDGGTQAMPRLQQAAASFDRGGAYRGRFNVREEQGGLSCTIRIISKRIPTTTELGLPNNVVELVGKPSGLLVFIGETGSGKSTSTAAMLNLVNERHPFTIYTIEDPIEYLYPVGQGDVIQREVGAHVESFAKGIEDAKRAHPRIIVVGEVLNAKTARAALQAAVSGHLVITTMHAGTAGEAVDSFTSYFSADEQGLVRTQLAQSLVGIVAQRLIRKPAGGLALAQEIALNTLEFSELVRGSGNRSADTRMIQQLLLGNGTRDGMVAMEHSIARLVHEGTLDVETAVRAAHDKKALKEKFDHFRLPIPTNLAA